MSLLLDSRTGHVCQLDAFEWDHDLTCHRLTMHTMSGVTIVRLSDDVQILANNILPFPQRMPATSATPSVASLRNAPAGQFPPASRGTPSNYGDV